MLTRSDIINIETGIVLAEMLGKKTATREHWTDIPLVLRVYDRTLGFAVAQRFGFENVRNYDGSWTEWGSAVRVPIVTGAEPGEVPAR